MYEYRIFDTQCDCEVLIRVGQNAKENWLLIDDADQNDLWFHVEDQPSPHVIIEIPAKCTITNATLKYAGSLCKQHSKYVNLNKVSIIYTEVKNLVKGKAAGSVTLKNSPQKMSV